MRQDSPKLLAQALLHFVLGGKNAYSASPPGLISRLNSTTCAPASANFLAAYSPAGPAPIMPIRCPRSVCVCVILPLFFVCTDLSCWLHHHHSMIQPRESYLIMERFLLKKPCELSLVCHLSSVYGEQHLANIAPFLEIMVCCRGCGKRERVRDDRVDLPLHIEL